jgi:hypothetical protein
MPKICCLQPEPRILGPGTTYINRRPEIARRMTHANLRQLIWIQRGMDAERPFQVAILGLAPLDRRAAAIITTPLGWRLFRSILSWRLASPTFEGVGERAYLAVSQ